MPYPKPTAAILVIGNEILSGRTRDANIQALAQKLAMRNIPVGEVRIIPDHQAAIIDALNTLRPHYTYVFTTGGIGPTHDDITVDAIAAAFGVAVVEDTDAVARLTHHYGAENLTSARRRMARIPQGAHLIDNPISAAPGMKIGNVFVMAGVPNIMAAMADSVVPTLIEGPKIYSQTISAYVAESRIAEPLADIASRHPTVDIGSYPWIRNERYGTALVARGTDASLVNAVAEAILAMVEPFDTNPTHEKQGYE